MESWGQGRASEDDNQADESEIEPAPRAAGRVPLTLHLSRAGVRVQREATPATPATASATAADAKIVDDGAALRPGQMARSQFLASLRGQVTSAADQELGPVWSATGCPYIDRWFADHATTPAAQLDALARRYSGLTTPAGATDYIAPIVVRLRAAIARWKAGGDVSADVAAAGMATISTPSPSGPMVQRKQTDAGEARAEAGSPVAIVDELGGGAALDPGHAARLGDAMGDSFTDVHVHTDAVAARKADELGARAFAVGNHIAFAAGEYQPGTAAGDVLLAHELAHVQQQRGATIDATARKRAEVEGPEGPLELEADQVAAAAAAALHGNGTTATQARAKAVGSLSLKRCPGSSSSTTMPRAVAPPIPTGHGADTHGSAALPDADQQTWLLNHLNPERVDTSAPVAPGVAPPVRVWDGLLTNPHHVRNRTALSRAMTHAIRVYLNSQMAMLGRLSRARRIPMTAAGTGTLAGHDTGVEGIAALANDAVNASFAGDTAGAAMSPTQRASTTSPLQATGANRTLFDQNDLADLRTGMAMNNNELAADAASWIGKSAPSCQAILSAHNLSPDSPGEQQTFWDALIHDFLANRTNRHDALLFQQFGLNTTTEQGVMLGTAADPRGFHGDRDAAARSQRWSLFVIAIHETMHRRAHPAYEQVETGQVMREGFCELFSEVVGNAILPALRTGGNEPMRIGVEGRDQPIEPAFIPAIYTIGAEYQPFYDSAKAIRDGEGGHPGIGDASCRAAYFQGHVELLGLTPPGATAAPVAAAGSRALPVPAGIHDVAGLATATGIARATLEADNPGIAAHFPATAVMTGCRIHIVISSAVPAGPHADPGQVEDRPMIAAQNGVSEADLARANPGIAVDPTTGAWPALHAGDRILVPVH